MLNKLQCITDKTYSYKSKYYKQTMLNLRTQNLWKSNCKGNTMTTRNFFFLFFFDNKAWFCFTPPYLVLQGEGVLYATDMVSHTCKFQIITSYDSHDTLDLGDERRFPNLHGNISKPFKSMHSISFNTTQAKPTSLPRDWHYTAILLSVLVLT